MKNETGELSPHNKAFWILGILLIMAGLGGWSSGEILSGTFFVLAGAVFLPPAKDKLLEVSNGKITRIIANIAAVFLFFMAIAVSGDIETDSTNIKTTESAKQEEVVKNDESSVEETSSEEEVKYITGDEAQKTGNGNPVESQEDQPAQESMLKNTDVADEVENGDTNEDAAQELEQVTASESSETPSQKNAVKKAKAYLRFSAFSYKGLVEQLEFEQFAHDDAVYGVDNSGANWNEQAAKKAKSYLDFSSFSRGSLIEQLKFEGFTQDQAEHGANAVGL